MKAQKSRSRFLLCVRNDGSEDLEPRKVYQILPDSGAVHGTASVYHPCEGGGMADETVEELCGRRL